MSSTEESQEGPDKSITIVAGEIFRLDPGGVEGLMTAISSRPAERKPRETNQLTSKANISYIIATIPSPSKYTK